MMYGTLTWTAAGLAGALCVSAAQAASGSFDAVQALTTN